MNALTPSTEEQIEQAQALLAHETNISTINPRTLLSTIQHTKGETIRVDIDQLRVMENFNPRIKNSKYYEHIRSLADSIISEGFYEDKPLCGVASFEGKSPVIKITDGHCRLQALKLAIQENSEISRMVPIVLKDRTTTEEDLLVSLVRSNEGKRFTPLELSIVAKRLLKYKWSEKLIAMRMGCSTEYVEQLLIIAGAPATIRQMIVSDDVPIAVALHGIRKYGSEATTVLQAAVERAKGEGHKRITLKHLPDQIYKKQLMKVAPTAITVIAEVQADQAFAQLPSGLKDKIVKILADMAAAQPASTTPIPSPLAGEADTGGTSEVQASEEPETVG